MSRKKDTYVSANVLAYRLVWLAQKFPEYKLKVPLMAWSKENSTEELQRLVQESIPCEIGEGVYIGTFAQRDKDLFVLIHPDKEECFELSRDIWKKDCNVQITLGGGLSVRPVARMWPFDEVPNRVREELFLKPSYIPPLQKELLEAFFTKEQIEDFKIMIVETETIYDYFTMNLKGEIKECDRDGQPRRKRRKVKK